MPVALSFSHSVAAAPMAGVRYAAARRAACRGRAVPSCRPASAAYTSKGGNTGLSQGGSSKSRDFDAEDLCVTRAAADKEVLARVHAFTAREPAHSKAKKSLLVRGSSLPHTFISQRVAI